jgi:hypothetical protein
LVFEVAPEPFNRVEFGALRRQKHGHDVCRPPHGFGFVPGTIIEHTYVQGRGQGRGEPIQPEWERPTVEVRQFEKEARPGGRFDRAVSIEVVKRVEHSGDRWQSAGGKATPDHRQEAEPGCVLGTDLERAD